MSLVAVARLASQLSETSMANWFYYNENGDKISVTGGQLKGLAKAGMITPETIIETEDGKTATARKVKGLTFVETVPPTESDTFTAPAEQKITTWFYYDNNNQKQGPVTGGQLKGLAKSGVITPETMIETEEGKTAPARRVKGLTFAETMSSVESDTFTAEEQAEIDRFCVENGSDVKALNKDGLTLLDLATQKGKIEVVKFLVSKGADVNAKGGSGATPLHLAVYRGDVEIVKLLVSAGADIHAKNKYGSTPLHSTTDRNLEIAKFLVSKGADIHEKDNNGTTPLHSAARSGKIEIVKFLVSKGADIHEKNNNGATPLHSAIYRYRECLEIVKFLISKGADVNEKDNNGETPFRRAIYEGELEIVRFLVSAGADVNEKDKYGATPLHQAAYRGELEIVKFLVSAGADLGAKNSSGGTPLNSVRGGLFSLPAFAAEKREKCTAVVQYLTSINAPATAPSMMKMDITVKKVFDEALDSLDKLGNTMERLNASTDVLLARANMPVRVFKSFWSDGNCGLLFLLALVATIAGICMAGYPLMAAYSHYGTVEDAFFAAAPAITCGIVIAIPGLIGVIMIDGYNLRCPSCGKYWAVTWDERHESVYSNIHLILRCSV